ncbi:MAG: hypothetical protein Q7S29_02640 [Candidatus Peribacter sp.]|nr:hypothetical protein [Candidatus Peribacter sp.]
MPAMPVWMAERLALWASAPRLLWRALWHLGNNRLRGILPCSLCSGRGLRETARLLNSSGFSQFILEPFTDGFHY